MPTKRKQKKTVRKPRIITKTENWLTAHAGWLARQGYVDKATEVLQVCAALHDGADGRETQEKRKNRKAER